MDENIQEQELSAQQLSELLQIRRDKLDALREAGKDPFVITKYDVTAYSADVKTSFVDPPEGEESVMTVSMAGRIMSKRGMGKASFADLQDKQGRIQLYVRKDMVGDDAYADFKKWDIGDIIGVTGVVFRTHMGEISVRATSVVLLAKSLLPLPEKFHGLKDPELRYRQRYVDLIVNPEVKDTFVKRSMIIKEIRALLDEEGFLEVETPVLNTIAGGASARPFITHHNALDIDMYMRIALELYLKRLIIGGFDRVYEIGRVFRNEGMDPRHNPEFTELELYQAYTNLDGMMDITEKMFRRCAENVIGKTVVEFDGHEIDLGKPFERITMTEAVKKYSGVDFDEIPDLETARKVAKEHGVEFEERHKKGDILAAFFDEFVEDKLIQPTFITEYPIEVSPLTKKDPEKPWMTQRFELFVAGREHANAYSELNDPIDQRERFMAQAALREQGDDEAERLDEDFLTAMEYGMPPTGGLGVGIDRMVQLLTGNYSIRDVLLFPTMKPLDSDKKVEKAAATPVEAAPVVEEKIDFSNVVIEPLFEDFVDFETFSKSDFRAVKVLECEAVPKSKKLLKFTLDDGTGVNRTILSGIHAFYEPEELVGKTLIAITNLPPRPMMGIDSCGMLLSAINKRGEEEELHLLMVDNHIPAGAKLY